MSCKFKPDWKCKPDCVAYSALKEHLSYCNDTTAAQRTALETARDALESVYEDCKDKIIWSIATDLKLSGAIEQINKALGEGK